MDFELDDWCNDYRIPEFFREILNSTIEPDTLWRDILPSLNGMRDPRRGDDFTPWIKRGEAWLVRCALHPDANLSPHQARLISQKLIKQPQCLLQDSDFAYQQDHMGAGPFPALTQALRLFQSPQDGIFDAEALQNILVQFARIAGTVATAWDEWEATAPSTNAPPYSVYTAAHNLMYCLWQRAVQDNFSLIPLSVRRVLASVNFSGQWDVLWSRAFQMRSEGHDRSTSIIYGLRTLIMDAFRATAENENDQVRRVSLMLVHSHGVRFTDHIVMNTVENRREVRWSTIQAHSRGFESNAVFNITDEAFAYASLYLGLDIQEILADFPLLDVELVPSGPPINIHEHVVHKSDPSLGVVCTICLEEFREGSDACVELKVCGHVFHLNCIDGLVNSGSTTSNICPNCRVVICERRAMEPMVAV